jgi:hypothetical protein
VTTFHPTVDDFWGRPCLAFHIQPGFAPGAQERLHALRERIVPLWPKPLRVGPLHSIHVTLYPLVPVPGDFDRDKHWRAVKEGALGILRRLCADAPALTLRYHRLIVMPAGIVAAAEDATGLVSAIRNEVLRLLPPPPGRSHVPYDLIHTTLARYGSTDPIDRSHVDAVNTQPVAVEARVDRIRLFQETLFPCIEGEELETFPLPGPLYRAP